MTLWKQTWRIHGYVGGMKEFYADLNKAEVAVNVDIGTSENWSGKWNMLVAADSCHQG